MNKATMEELFHASVVLHLSKTCIIRLLLKQFLDDEKKMSIFTSPVKYQERDNKSNWRTFHLTLREDEYELCMDLRKVCKMSLSFIIAFAVGKYLKNIIKIFNSQAKEIITDNYLFHNYAFSYKIINGTSRLVIYWGITNLEEILTDNYQNII